jgi:hypothetical protein
MRELAVDPHPRIAHMRELAVDPHPRIAHMRELAVDPHPRIALHKLAVTSNPRAFT